MATAPPQPTVATDFNMDKIKALNKLHYPRLNWSKEATGEAVDTAENGNNVDDDDDDDEEWQQQVTLKVRAANKSGLSDEQRYATSDSLLAQVSEATRRRNAALDSELVRFFDNDQFCKVYTFKSHRLLFSFRSFQLQCICGILPRTSRCTTSVARCSRRRTTPHSTRSFALTRNSSSTRRPSIETPIL